VENLKILLPRAESAREILASELTRLGAIVDDVPAYRTVPETEDVAGGIRRYREEGADMVTFTSSSTAENFHALNLPAPDGLRHASIGPITTKTMAKLGMSVDVESRAHDVPGLVSAIVKFYDGAG
jgi:uroporphyrinogen III methyltransferase/synthase